MAARQRNGSDSSWKRSPAIWSSLISRSQNVNRLHPRFTFCDLLIKLLQIAGDLFQLESDPLRWRAAIHQKRAWPFAATDLRYDVFNLPPRRDPFAPHDDGKAAQRHAN